MSTRDRLERMGRAAGWRMPILYRVLAEIKNYRELDANHPHVKTMGVTKDFEIVYNKKFVDELSDEELTGGMAHELLHLLTVFWLRKEKRDHKRFNVAADMAINSMIYEAGLTLPEKAAMPLTPEMHDMSAEQIYAWMEEHGYEVTEDPTFANGCGVEGDDGEFTPEESHNLRSMAGDVKKSIAGNGVLKRLFHMLGNKEQPPKWSSILKGQMAKAKIRSGRDDQSFTKRNRRSPDDIYLPGWIGFSARGAVILDTSGSMSDEEVTRCVSEVLAIQKTFPEVRLYLILHDFHVYSEGWINAKTSNSVASRVTSRGGTSFDAAYASLNKLGRLDFAVHLTDGEIWDNWPAKPAGVHSFVMGLFRAEKVNAPEWIKQVCVSK